MKRQTVSYREATLGAPQAVTGKAKMTSSSSAMARYTQPRLDEAQRAVAPVRLDRVREQEVSGRERIP